MKILITGGAGFIGVNLIHLLMEETDHAIVNADKLTYAGNLNSLSRFDGDDRLIFERADIANAEQVKGLFDKHRPDWVMHLAAESHVDRSIDNPDAFIQTNIVGTFNLLHAAREYFETLDDTEARKFRFHHVSTDEVYGSLDFQQSGFTEITPYAPHSPYSASKAASDHLVRSWHDTYGLPVLITNCSNNYGPFQFPEKLVPVVILKAISGEPIPIYGKGENVRDWLYVTDHAKALYTVITRGKLGQTYNIGGNNERQNIDLVKLICEILDELCPVAENQRLSEKNRINLKSYSDLIEFVRDRPGHDLRYAIDATKISTELGWQPEEDFSSGFRKTVRWYLENKSWWENILSGDYRIERLGVSSTYHNEIEENK